MTSLPLTTGLIPASASSKDPAPQVPEVQGEGDSDQASFDNVFDMMSQADLSAKGKAAQPKAHLSDAQLPEEETAKGSDAEAPDDAPPQTDGKQRASKDTPDQAAMPSDRPAPQRATAQSEGREPSPAPVQSHQRTADAPRPSDGSDPDMSQHNATFARSSSPKPDATPVAVRPVPDHPSRAAYSPVPADQPPLQQPAVTPKAAHAHTSGVALQEVSQIIQTGQAQTAAQTSAPSEARQPFAPPVELPRVVTPQAASIPSANQAHPSADTPPDLPRSPRDAPPQALPSSPAPSATAVQSAPHVQAAPTGQGVDQPQPQSAPPLPEQALAKQTMAAAQPTPSPLATGGHVAAPATPQPPAPPLAARDHMPAPATPQSAPLPMATGGHMPTNAVPPVTHTLSATPPSQATPLAETPRLSRSEVRRDAPPAEPLRAQTHLAGATATPAPVMTAVPWTATASAEGMSADPADLRLAELGAAATRSEVGQTSPATTPPPRADLPAQVARQLAEVLPQASNRPVEITLSPEELGRVRLSLTMSETQVTVNLLAERPETLDLLRRHIDILGQEFRDLGFESIAFAFGGDSTDTAAEGDMPEGDDTTPTDAETAAVVTLKTGPATGLDLRL